MENEEKNFTEEFFVMFISEQTADLWFSLWFIFENRRSESESKV